jgi:S-adenosylmethionine-diacylgycerolhomoserine-N-methlytransferase
MAYSQLAPGGELHVVDFADQSGWPAWFARLLRRWLQKFHVTPRMELAAELKEIAADSGAEVRHQLLYRGYAQYGVLRHPKA